MVTVTTNVASDQCGVIADTMFAAAKQVPSLTPRTYRQLLKSLHSGNIAVAFDGDKLIGWLMATPYIQDIQELGMAFVLPGYRHQGILKHMIACLIDKRPMTLVVTYETKIATMLVSHWQFQPSSLVRFAYLTRSQFIVGRLSSLTSIKTVLSHMAKAKPIYLERICK